MRSGASRLSGLLLLLGACAPQVAPSASAPAPAAALAASTSVAATASTDAGADKASIAVPESLSRDDAASDVRELVALLESVHPDCYSAFGGRISFNRAVQRLLADIPGTGLAASELERRLVTFLATLSDGHTYIHSDKGAFDEDSARLPVAFGVTADGLYLSAANTPELAHSRGAPLVSYGGLSVPELVARLRRFRQIENEYQAYKFLPSWLTHASGCSRLIERECGTSPLQLVFRSRDGKLETRPLTFAPDPHRDVASFSLPPAHKYVLPKSDDPFFGTLLAGGTVGYLRVRTMMERDSFDSARRLGLVAPEVMKKYLGFVYDRLGKPMPAEIGAAIEGLPSFQEHAHALLVEMKAKGARTLVLDLRDDDGGNDAIIAPFLYELFGDAFYGHKWKVEAVSRYSDLFLHFLNRTIDDVRKETGDPTLEVGGYAFDKPEPGTPQEIRARAIKKYADGGFPFAARLLAQGGQPFYRPGRTLVLSDEGTFSAAFDFLAQMKELGAELVGVPPMQSPNAFMEVTPFTLSRSRLEGSISSQEQMYLPETPSARVMPLDHPLTWEVAAKYGFDDDATLEYALSLASARGR
jgi:hypothetical protein